MKRRLPDRRGARYPDGMKHVMKHGGPRRPSEPELWGAKEAAAELGVRQPNLRALRDLPEPYSKVGATTLWRADEIRALARRRRGEDVESEDALTAA